MKLDMSCAPLKELDWVRTLSSFGAFGGILGKYVCQALEFFVLLLVFSYCLSTSLVGFAAYEPSELGDVSR